MKFLQTHRRDLLFTAVILVLAGVLYLWTHPGGTGAVAVLRYGDPQQEQTIDLTRDAGTISIPVPIPSICRCRTEASPLWTAPAPTTCAKDSAPCGRWATGPPACPPKPA